MLLTHQPLSELRVNTYAVCKPYQPPSELRITTYELPRPFTTQRDIGGGGGGLTAIKKNKNVLQ